MSTINIISDIAGRFDELMLLLEKMPKADEIVLVGDLMDRGPKSKEVIEWAMSTPGVTAIYGNHDDMMVEAWTRASAWNQGLSLNDFDFTYDAFDWVNNGGNATINSYGVANIGHIPREHIHWLRRNPRFVRRDGLYISHAPCLDGKLGENSMDPEFLWNRIFPEPVKDVYQVYGHNGRRVVTQDFACIDNCFQSVLTGMHWPTRQIFEVQYLDVKP